MHHRIRTIIVGGLAAGAVAVGSIAGAAVLIDTETGEGFVGKGDVQTAYAMNNKAMQAEHEAITFKYSETESLVQDCVDNDRGTFTVVGSRSKTSGLEAEVASDSRKTGQWTGWYLEGFDEDSVVEGEGQWIGSDGTTTGNACPAGSNPQGQPQRTGSSGGSLIAIHPTLGERVIWTAPAPE